MQRNQIFLKALSPKRMIGITFRSAGKAVYFSVNATQKTATSGRLLKKATAELQRIISPAQAKSLYIGVKQTDSDMAGI